MPGRYFDEWQVGDRVEHSISRTVTETDNLLISTLTGGNMFQSWNVANITNEYFGVPQVFSGIVLAVTTGAVTMRRRATSACGCGPMVSIMRRTLYCW